MAKKKDQTPAAELVEIKAEIEEQTKELAVQLKYDGCLTPDALQDGIQASKQRVNQELFSIGARLLLLKQQCEHGDFQARCAAMDLEPRLAQRTMQAALKFSNASTSTHLIGMSKSKIFELLVLDDDEIKQLSQDGSVRGIELDEIDSLSVSELRKRLRDAKADSAAKDEVIQKNATKIQKLQQGNAKQRALAKDTPQADLDLIEYKARVNEVFMKLGALIQDELSPAVANLMAHGEHYGLDTSPYIDGLFDGLNNQCLVIYDEHGVAQGSATAGDFSE